MTLFTRFIAWTQLIAGVIAGGILINEGSHTVIGYYSHIGMDKYGTSLPMIGSGAGLIAGCVVLFCVLMLMAQICDNTKKE